MKVNVTFEEGDLDSLHDIVYGLTGKPQTHKELELVWKKLPEHIKEDAIRWGIDDSVVRDNIYVHLKTELTIDTHSEDEF